MTEGTPERHKLGSGWRTLFFVVIGFLFLAFAVILMVDMFGHPGGALVGVVRPSVPFNVGSR